MQDFNGGIIMIILNIIFGVIFGVIVVMSVTFFIFHTKDVLAFWWVKGKAVVLGIWKWLKGFNK